jgi:phosphate transport system protein
MDHTSTQYDLELRDLRTGFLEMGALVNVQLQRALELVLSGNKNLLATVFEQERLVNETQLKLDHQGLQLIAKRQPAAVDLRLIMCTVSAVSDLERIGDEVKKIAQRAGQFEASDKFKALGLNEINNMGDMAHRMLSRAMLSFAQLDVLMAADVISKDATVDTEYERIMRMLVTLMVEDPKTISAGLDVAFLVKAIERVADHAKNISEYTIHIVQGKDPRHPN